MLLIMYCVLFLILAVTLFITYRVIRGILSVTKLSAISNDSRTIWPKVSIIVPAHNEEQKLRSALISMCQLNYPNYEVIAVDDRSTDKTFSIMMELKNQFKNLTVLKIDHLPDYWLGKTNALAQGITQATGDYYLLTDADAVMEQSLLVKAINHMEKNKLSHLTMEPNFMAPYFLLKIFILFFSFSLRLEKSPWKIKDPESDLSIGIGAFNLITKEAYQKIGGMQVIAFCPMDDVALGLEIKKNHLRQDIAISNRLLKLEWYHTFQEAAIGLEKNVYAYLNFRISTGLLYIFLYGVFFLIPFIALLFSLQLLGLVVIIYLVMTLNIVLVANQTNINPVYAFFYPLGAILSIYLIIRAITLAIVRKGIIWRGTFYSLKELRDFHNNRNK